MTRIRTFATALAAGFALAAAPAAAQDPIQPGAYMASGSSGCTLNFIYDGTGALAGRVYVGTAAHCLDAVDDDVELADGTVFGDAALIGDEGVAEEDYAFIEVRPAYLGRVSPALKGHPTIPRVGYTTPGETATGDLVQQSGYGTGASVLNITRERRQSVLTYDDAELHQVFGYNLFGDSGGPFVHVRTGKALGIVSRLCIGLCQEMGPTVQGAIAKAAERGFTVKLRTV